MKVVTMAALTVSEKVWQISSVKALLKALVSDLARALTKVLVGRV
jgi:hypothetical protein